MSSNIASQSTSGLPKRTSFGNFAGNNASMLLDRAKGGIRGSTPDSEALVSSDDEPDHLHRLQTVTSNPGSKPNRRTSWFTESQQGPARQPSLAGNGPFSPVSPGTMTSGDQAPWSANTGSSTNSTMGRGHSNSASFPWGNTIWNNDSQKGPPQRLSEVLPSPTTLVPPGSAGLLQDDNPIRSPPLSREQPADPAIPFSIPLQPTLKSYRSQSYSVGQIDPESAPNPSGPFGIQSAYSGAKRGTSYAGLHHRPSRPSLLADTSHDPNPLGQLREVEDDEESLEDSTTGFQSYAEGSRTVEDIVGENAMLRQQLAANHLQSQRSTRSSMPAQKPPKSGQYYHHRIRDSVPEESTSTFFEGIEDDHIGTQKLGGPPGRRFSEYGTKSGPHYALGVNADHKILDGVRKGQWQSSLGFARVEEPPQSRRHSFAEMPTRHNSLDSTGDDNLGPVTGESGNAPQARHENGFGDHMSHHSQGEGGKSAIPFAPRRKTSMEIEMVAQHSLDRDYAVKYFSRNITSSRTVSDLQSPSTSSLHQAFAQGQYPRPQPLQQISNRSSQLLYIVTFKCLRADVFYVQEGTGLRVKKGDLVIVEADRGTDLGTVQTDDISWVEAKQLKEEYTLKHHEWLMAFSHHTQNGTVAGANPNGPPISQNAIGTFNPAGFQDLPSGDIKPKMIKRLAQNHEIATLREKEGGEAKAKRMCQQKVVDHRLNMEILDAEFQMDWKKLTFFYFADSYINFNPLVTDLFKIYKTRIWMSAINTAAISSPPGGPKSIGMSPRGMHNPEYDDYRTAQYVPSVTPNPAHAPMTAFNTMYDPNRSGMMMSGIPYGQIYPQSLEPQGFQSREMSPFPVDYRQQGQQTMHVSSPFGDPTGYSASNLHHASSFTSQAESANGGHQNRQVQAGEWTQAFQGLSLDR